MEAGQVVALKLFDGTVVIRRVVEVKGAVVALCSVAEYARAVRECRRQCSLDFPIEDVDEELFRKWLPVD